MFPYVKRTVSHFASPFSFSVFDLDFDWEGEAAPNMEGRRWKLSSQPCESMQELQGHGSTGPKARKPVFGSASGSGKDIGVKYWLICWTSRGRIWGLVVMDVVVRKSVWTGSQSQELRMWWRSAAVGPPMFGRGVMVRSPLNGPFKFAGSGVVRDELKSGDCVYRVMVGERKFRYPW